ncbi:DUF1214 domain-containing protein [Parahaliea aestuarii]|uniref:DUF1254 domain-containing protein n=1 Tax=Parahaliea aestuarii TaxID=1852021 RepID=A0A5C9A0D6_9GAMM|nr:DUF1214 domain-containing protein [Parahaliea aestuarii]TXS93454.1 DUF1254 domain-containing protein [Parahaliea aestuarii]
MLCHHFRATCTLWIAVTALCLAVAAAPLKAAHGDLSASGISADLTPAQISELTAEAYYWGLNIAGFYELRYLYTQLADERNPIYTGINRLNPLYKLMDARDRYATTVNASTLYSGGMFDVSQEPVVLETTAIAPGRYWSLQTVDQYARWFLLAGPQFTGSHAQRYLIVGPDWQGALPPEFASTQIIQAPSAAFSATLRVAVLDRNDPEDLAGARQVVDSFSAGPLSLWREHGGAFPPLAEQPKIRADYRSFPRMAMIGDIGKSMTGVDLLQLLSLAVNDSAMTLQRDSQRETSTLKRLAALGIAPGKRFDPSTLSAAQRDAVNAGYRDARPVARAAMAAALVDMNGWQLQSSLFYDDLDYRGRAGAQDVAWGSPVHYQSHSIAYLFDDSEGRPLDSDHRYTLSFDVDQLPPVTEFWELPVYDAQGYLVDNAIDRYNATSYQYQAGDYHVEDGKLVFYLQREAPTDPDQQRNWLPLPAAGGFQFAARFYGPMAPLIDGRYAMPQVVRVD